MPEVPVRVFVRIRPLLVHDRVGSSELCVRAVSHDQLVLGKDRSFRFDRVFPPETPQADVYGHCVAPLVSACLEGYNATVFAYGQTGSGKSHTMGSEDCQGGGARGEGQGVIPRALEEIFGHIQASPGVEFAVRVSYVEVYKEEPRDLLEGGVSGREVLIREDQQGNTVVMGCQEEDVGCVDDALGWLETGNAARVTGATRMNQRSSRSHAIFTVSVEQKWKVLPKEATPTAPPTNETTPSDEAVERCLSSKFHFVDLAGSERVGRTGNLGERFKESVHINSGLLALGNVISALGDPKRKSTHVPYRESKITRILKDSLGGNARTVMITCLSPAAANFAENLNSLKYAKRARNIRNRPIVNRDPQAHRLQEMKEEIEALRGELWRARLSSKPSTVATTVDTSVMVELSDVEAHMSDLERELTLSRQRCSQYHTHLLAARDQLLALRGATVPSSLGAGSAVLQRMEEWLAGIADLEEALPAGSLGLPPQPNQHGSADTHHSPISKRALETMEILQAELEQCHVDLVTDEELFAEKVDELNLLQTNYDILRQEKERIEQMWSIAMETEAQLHQEVGQLLESLSALEGELSSRDSTIEELRGQLGERGRDKAPAPETQGRKACTIEDYTDEKVLESLRLLTDKLVQAQEHHEQAPMAILLALDAGTDTRTQPTARTTDLPFGQTRTIITNTSRDPKSTQVDLYDSIDETNPRVPTPIELSPCEPERSHSSHFFREQQVWNQSRQLKRGSDSDAGETGHMTMDHLTVGHVIRNGSSAVRGEGGASEMERLNQSAVASKREISLAEEKLSDAQDELRNLNLKIRLKEELIKELVKNSRTSKRLNETYLTKIQTLEQEATSVQKDLQRFQASLQRPQARGEGERGEDVKIVEEQKRKLAGAERRLAALQRKQKETERVIQFGKKSERRISELEGGIERLRNHQEILKRRLKKESHRKTKLETDLQKYQHRIKSLQTRSDHQSKVLKIKTEEVAAAHRKLRRLSSRPNSQIINDSESPQLVAQRAWLDAEVERMLQQKEAVEMLEKELSERERILSEKEALIAERDTLEMMRVRSSQAVTREVLRLSMQIESIEGSIKSKGEELRTPKSSSSRQQNTHQEIAKLTQERDKLIQQRDMLEQKMKDGTLLPREEQRKLCELNECIEVLEATVDFTNDSITSRQLDIAQIIQSGEISSEIQDKLAHLSLSDAQALLTRYFQKVVHLRLSENQHRHTHRELEAEIAGQQQIVCRLERSLKQAQFEMEKRLISQQKEHERQVRFLMQQLAENNPENISPAEVESRKIEQMEAKIKQLEKDLYYYKKTSRDLKKKIRGAQMERGEATGTGSSSRDQSDTSASNLKMVRTEALKSDHNLGKGCVGDSLSGNTTSSKDGTEPQDHMQLPLQSQFKDDSSKILVESDEITRAKTHESSSVAIGRTEMDHKHLKDSTRTSFGADATGVCTDGTGITIPRRLVEEQSSPVSSRSGVTSAGIVRKPKKQLRQLSASDIAERMARQGTVLPQTMQQSSGSTSLEKEHR